LMNSLPLRENHSASEENISGAPPAQPAIKGANSSNASTRFP
jgi:hypothetical protein